MRGFVVLLLLLIVGYLLYANFSTTSQPTVSPPSQPTALPTATPPAGDANWRLNAAQATPALSAPSQGAAKPARSLLDRLNELAAKAGVQVQITIQEGQNANVRVEWMGDVATNGGDFLDLVLRERIARDFKDLGGRRWYDPEGRSRWTQDFVLMLF